MDLVTTIVNAALSTLEPLIEKGAKAASNLVLAKAQELLNFLKRKLEGDSKATDIVERFEHDPDLFEDALRKILTQHLSSNPDLTDQLKEYLKAQGSKIEVDINVGSGEEIVGADIGTSKQSLDAKAKIKADQAKRVVGVKIDRLE